MITAAVWVPRGAPASFPTTYDIDDEEIARISRLAKIRLDNAKEDLIPTPNEARQGGKGSESEDSEMEDVITTE